jgi:IS5 family transposase
MSKPDDDLVTIAKVIDLDRARGRREEAVRLAEEVEVSPDKGADVERARVEADRVGQRDRTARKRRRLQERTACQRAAASSYRIQVRVADRLARIEAELEAEIARLRLAYVQGRNHAIGGLWMWPTVAVSLLVLVAGLAYFAGTQQTIALPAVELFLDGP